MAKSAAFQGIVVCYGEEDFLLDREVRRFQSTPNRTCVTVDAGDVSESELISILETRSVEGNRLVIIDNAQKVKVEKKLKAHFESKVESADLSIIVMAVIRADRPTAAWAQIAAMGRSIECTKFRSWETEKVVKWAVAEAKKMGLALKEDIASLLVMYVGTNLYFLANELAKIATVCPPGTPATADVIRQVISPTAKTDVFKVVDAAVNKNPLLALNALSELYRTASEDPSIGLTYALMKHVETMFIARSMLDTNQSPEEIATRVGWHIYRCKQSLFPQVQKHSLQGLMQIMQRLCGLDMEMKKTSNSKRTHLELAIVALAS